jgi:hypothetical protein
LEASSIRLPCEATLEMAVEKKASLAAKNWFWQSKKRPLES